MDEMKGERPERPWPVPSEFGNALRDERRRRQWSQREAAAYFKISQPAFFRWEASQNMPDTEQYARVADFLGITLDEVWRILHHGEKPASLEDLHREVEGLKRDIATLREMMRERDAAVAAVAAPAEAPPAEAVPLTRRSRGAGSSAPAAPEAPAAPKARRGRAAG